MATKKEFKVNYRKSVNSAWEASAYFIDPVNEKCYSISVAAGPNEKSKTAKPYIKERLDAAAIEFLTSHPTFIRIDVEEYDKIYWKGYKNRCVK